MNRLPAILVWRETGIVRNSPISSLQEQLVIGKVEVHRAI